MLMLDEKTICIFSLAKSDPTFRSVVSVVGAIKWLESKKEAPHRYFFNEKKPKKLLVGSKVLFAFDGQIFGEAVVMDDIKPMANTASYKFFLTLDPSNIQIYRFYPTKEEASRIIGKGFGQLFTYITQEQYGALLKIANRPLKTEG